LFTSGFHGSVDELTAVITVDAPPQGDRKGSIDIIQSFPDPVVGLVLQGPFLGGTAYLNRFPVQVEEFSFTLAVKDTDGVLPVVATGRDKIGQDTRFFNL
jgi:hypothetical protein